MLQYNTGLLDKSRYFNAAGALGRGVNRSIKDIAQMAGNRRKQNLRSQSFSGYNPQTDPEGVNYRQRQRDYFGKLTSDWRTADKGHQGMQALHEQARADRQRRVKEEYDRLTLDSARIKNRMDIVKADQFKNGEIDNVLAYMSKSPEAYTAGYQELQKYFPSDLQGMGLPQEFNKDSQAKILMRRGVSKKIKAINDAKLKELQQQEDRAYKYKDFERKAGLEQSKFDFEQQKYDKDYELKKTEQDLKLAKTPQIKLSAAEKNDLGTIAKSVEAFNAVSKMFKENDLSGLKAAFPGMISKLPVVGGKLQPEPYEYEKLKRRLAEDALRDATGAAAPAHEVRTYMAFFPDVGDTEREAQAKIEGMKVFLRGKGEKVALGLEASGNKTGADSIRGIYEDKIGSISDIYTKQQIIEVDDETGERYRFLGGDKTDPKNWELIK